MEFPVAYLQDCAVAEKWLPFICYAQACQVPKEQVLLPHHFQKSLKSNLYMGSACFQFTSAEA